VAKASIGKLKAQMEGQVPSMMAQLGGPGLDSSSSGDPTYTHRQVVGLMREAMRTTAQSPEARGTKAKVGGAGNTDTEGQIEDSMPGDAGEDMLDAGGKGMATPHDGKKMVAPAKSMTQKVNKNK
jgi:hypothetical protein